MNEEKKYPRMSDNLTFHDIWDMGKDGVECRYCKGDLVNETGQVLRREPDWLFLLTYRCEDCGDVTAIRLLVDA